MEKLAYPSNIMQDIGINIAEVTDETRQNFVRLLDNGVLNDRLTHCVKEYYRNGRTLEDIAQDFGVTRERIRQLLGKAKDKLATNKATILGITQYQTEKEKLEDEISKLQTRLLRLQSVADEINLDELERKYEVKIKFDTSAPLEAVKGMTNRTYNCLKRAGLNTLDEVFEMSEYELKSLKNMGTNSIQEIKILGHLYGKKLR